jgi:hypothetical protein
LKLGADPADAAARLTDAAPGFRAGIPAACPGDLLADLD